MSVLCMKIGNCPSYDQSLQLSGGDREADVVGAGGFILWSPVKVTAHLLLKEWKAIGKRLRWNQWLQLKSVEYAGKSSSCSQPLVVKRWI